MKIYVTKTFLPSIEEYKAQLERIWESRWITNRGILVKELEQKLRDYLGVKNILLVNNGTIALQIAIKSLELKGEIITTPFSYVATVSSIVWENCKPVFVDIEEEYLSIDENKIEEKITKSTCAILATHVYGNPCNVKIIEKIAKQYNLKVIYDAAHCFGVKYEGSSILNWGDVSTLSFHATKLFHTGEGGAIVSKEDELANKIFYHHNFGHKGEEDFWGLGINGKMSELNAAMGLALLPYMDRILSERKRVFESYNKNLRDLPLKKLKIREGTEWNFSYYPVLFDSEDSLLKVKKNLNENDIFPRRYFYPSLNKLPYLNNCRLPIAEDISKRILCLPLSAELGDSEVEFICNLIYDALC
ncbi:MAG: DegT/DnrJ/EryC1/StrS family aminotransferase [Deltaproteobacteria bacterium]|nr:DegT/DnrJ/EryC1/StrS family aminotransferase [Deltaproteobacteria bacterium]